MNYSQLYAIAETGSVASVVVDGDSVIVTKTDATRIESTVAASRFGKRSSNFSGKNHVPVEFASTNQISRLRH
jgi:hypothetical protein